MQHFLPKNTRVLPPFQASISPTKLLWHALYLPVKGCKPRNCKQSSLDCRNQLAEDKRKGKSLLKEGSKSLQPISSVQFSLVAQSSPTLCHPMNHSTPGLPVHHQFPEFTQTHVHWVSDDIQPSHPLSSPSPPSLNLSQHQDLFKWVSSSHQVAKVLEFQLQHQSSQWTPRTDLL